MAATYTPVRGVPPVRRRRGARALTLRALLLLSIAALPTGFSAWIDPARLVATRRAEAEIARVLASGRNVTDYANYDDRAIERSLVALRPARAEVLGLGSSRLQPMPASAFGGAVFMNGAMQGATLDDMLAVYGLYDSDARRPTRVVINVDPWTQSYDASAGWASISDERTAVMRRAGIPASPRRERAALTMRTLRQLAMPEYFRLSVGAFKRHGTAGIRWVATDRAQNMEKTKLPNGSVIWSDVPADNAIAASEHFARGGIFGDQRFRRLDARAPGREDALEKFVRYLRSEGVAVTVLLVPFPDVVYDAFVGLPGYSVIAVERDLRALAERNGAEIVGSYDPRVVGMTTLDFFDEDHLRPEALARLVAR
ncbi:MAG: hypothetical protein JWL95_657 [Gemmatimonadetes bacterium]|nr:hypothetical protein [Gemmatimonadota bacterium]